MIEPLISVIIPAYNAEKTIKQTIESVLNQKFTDFELIVINDGSTDTTLEIINSILDSRIRVFSYPNSGPQKSRNRGITKAQGKYLAFLDADDLWTEDKLESQFQALENNPEVAVVYSWTDWIDENGEFWRRGSHISAEGNIFNKLLLIDFIGSGSNPLIRADTIRKVEGFDESLVGGQDWEMWLRLAANYLFTVVPKAHILYRKSLTSQSWSNNVERQEQGFKQVITKAINYAPESVEHLKNQIIANRYKCLLVDALERPAGKKRVLVAIRYLFIIINKDPAIIRTKTFIKILFRILVMLIFSDKQAQFLLKKSGKMSEVATLFGYLKMEA